MASEAQRRATARYIKQRTRQYLIHCNVETEADIIARLDSVENKAGYIKGLIRADCLKMSDSGNAREQEGA